MEMGTTLADPQILIRVREAWNHEADQFNQWDTLGLDEKIDLISKDILQSGDLRYFRKSGNQVRLIESNGNDWEVQRVDGESSGKRMLCPSESLVWCLSGAEEESVCKVEGSFNLQ